MMNLFNINTNPLDIYPVGSIYLSLNDNNPTDLFGGKWEKLENSFLVGASSKYPLNSRGGARKSNSFY